MKIYRETRRDSKWIYYNVYDYEKSTDTYTFITESLQMTDDRYNRVFGVLKDPVSFLKKNYDWDITPQRWAALVSIYEDDIHRLVWDLHEMVSCFINIDVNMAVDIILAGKKIKTSVAREYLMRLCRGDFTKQDGKDILIRLEAGEHPETVYIDKKYEKASGIENIVKKVYEANLDKFGNPKTQAKMASWLVGQVMKETRGKCSPQEVRELIEILLKK